MRLSPEPRKLWGMKLLPHLCLETSELEPGAEWAGQGGQWKILRLGTGAAYWLGGSTALDLSAGEVLVVGPAAPGLLRASRLGRTQVQSLQFSPEHLAGLLSLSERLSLEAVARSVQARVHPTESELARDYAELVSRPVRRRSFLYRCRILNLVALALGEELPPILPKSGHLATSLARFEATLAEITDTDLIHCSSEQLAAMCGCSLRHFRRMFRAQFKTSVRAKQTELRLEKARQLLLETEDQMAVVARAAGYQHLGFFNLMFKKRFGMTPTEWRRRHGQTAAAGSVAVRKDWANL